MKLSRLEVIHYYFMRTSYWFLGIALVFIISVGFKFQFSSASADTIDAGSTAAAPLVLAVQTAIASSTSAALASSTAATSGAPVAVATPSDAQPTAPAPVKPVAAAPTQPAKKTMGTSGQYPERLLIPSLGLNVGIQPVGLNSKGEMDVPNGSSSNVGWYKYGTMPGNVGSAVLDAHVFAVFKDLRYLKIGSSVYVTTQGGTKLRFKVVDSRIYTLDELTSNILFGQHDARRLNLITCAGTYIPSINTYDHRLVVFAIFEDEE